MRRAQNPALGILPLIIAGGAALATAAGGAAYWWNRKENDKAEWDLINLPNPKPAPAPSAPRTAAEMRTWSPAQQQAADRAAYSVYAKTAMDEAADFLKPPQDPDDMTGLYIAAAAVVAALILTRN